MSIYGPPVSRTYFAVLHRLLRAEKQLKDKERAGYWLRRVHGELSDLMFKPDFVLVYESAHKAHQYETLLRAFEGYKGEINPAMADSMRALRLIVSWLRDIERLEYTLYWEE